jgi:hypothetical protein
MRAGELRKTLSSYVDVNDNAMASETKKINSIQGDKDFFENAVSIDNLLTA